MRANPRPVVPLRQRPRLAKSCRPAGRGPRWWRRSFSWVVLPNPGISATRPAAHAFARSAIELIPEFLVQGLDLFRSRDREAKKFENARRKPRPQFIIEFAGAGQHQLGDLGRDRFSNAGNFFEPVGLG